jgi:hypothetical protein
VSAQTLEERVAALEQKMERVESALPTAPPAQDRWWEKVGPSFGDDPVFAAMLAYGRYFRITGQDPPPNWKPGDPIPEPNYDEERL